MNLSHVLNLNGPTQSKTLSHRYAGTFFYKFILLSVTFFVAAFTVVHIHLEKKSFVANFMKLLI